MRVITVASLKGGVGKTAISIFLALALKKSGYRVCVIDVDPNNNLTDYFLRSTDPEEIERRNVKQILTGESGVEKCIHESMGISVIPCTVALHTASHELSRSPGSILRFSSLVRRMNFDAVIIDTPPFPGYELSVALHASDVIVSPVSLSRWTVQACYALEGEIEMISSGMKRRPVNVSVPVLVTEREERILRKSLNGMPVLKSAIHRSACIRTSAERGSLLRDGTKSEAEFMALAGEVMS